MSDILRRSLKQEYAIKYKEMIASVSTVYFAITERCNMKCRHCCAIHGTGEVSREDAVNWIRQIAESKVESRIAFLGGEPTLCLDDLIEYVKCARENGLLPSIVTNGYFAKTKEAAEKVLDKLEGLESVVISSDKYHLEFVDKETVCNLIDACLKRNLRVSINITAANKEEGMEVSRIYSMKYFKQILDYRVYLSISQMFKRDLQQDFEIEEFNFAENPDVLDHYCAVRSHAISHKGDVHMCCGNERIGDNELFMLGNLKKETYTSMMKRRSGSVVYNFFREYGPAGLAEIIRESPLKDAFYKTTFTHHCDLCLWAFANEEFCRYFKQEMQRRGMYNEQ